MTTYRIAFTVSARTPMQDAGRIRNPRTRQARLIDANDAAEAVAKLRSSCAQDGLVLHSMADPQPINPRTIHLD